MVWERGKEWLLPLALAGAFEEGTTGTDTVLAKDGLRLVLVFGARRRLEELRLLSRDWASIRSDSTLKDELVR